MSLRAVFSRNLWFKLVETVQDQGHSFPLLNVYAKKKLISSCRVLLSGWGKWTCGFRAIPNGYVTVVAADSPGELHESQDQTGSERDLKANIHQMGAERKSKLFYNMLTNSNSVTGTTDIAISVIKKIMNSKMPPLHQKRTGDLP